MNIASILEACMIISFGVSWPMSILKSHKARTTKGKSLFFLCLVFFGYICGVFSKFFSQKITYVAIFYILNLLMVGIDLVLYFRNKKIDQQMDEVSNIKLVQKY